MNEVDHEYTDEIVCPWCGYEFSDSWEFGNGGEFTELEDCPECDKSFYASRTITVAYTTQKVTYGTCSKCGVGDVPLDSLSSSFHSYIDYCQSCIRESENLARRNYVNSILGLGRD